MLVAVMPMAALDEGETALCRASGRDLLVACVEGRYFAVAGHCTHAGQSLERARLDGHELVCPRHGARFDIRTGACTRGPAASPLRSFPILIEHGKLCVDL